MSGNEQQEQQQPSPFMQTPQQQQISLSSNQQRQQQHAANQQQQVLMQQQQQYHQFQQLQQQQQQNQYMQQQQQHFEPPTPRQPLFRVVHGSSSTSSTRVQGRPYNVRQQTAQSPPLRPGLSEQQQQQPCAPMQQYPPPGYFNVVQNGRSFMIRPLTNFRPAFSQPQQQNFRPAFSQPQQQNFRPGFSEQQQQNFRPGFSEQQQQNFRPAFSEQQQQNFRPGFPEQHQQNFRPAFSEPQQQQHLSEPMRPRFYQFGTQTPPPASNILYSTAQERHSTPQLSHRPRAAMTHQCPSAPSQTQAYFHPNQRYPFQPQNLCSPEQAHLPPFQPPRQTFHLSPQQQQQLAPPAPDAASLASEESSLQEPTAERRLSETSDCEVIDERKERYVELAYYQLNIEQIGTVRIAEVDYTSLPPEIAAKKDRLERELENDGENDEGENEPGNESEFDSSAIRTKLS